MNNNRNIVSNIKRGKNSNDEIITKNFVIQYANEYIQIISCKINQTDFIDCDLYTSQIISTEINECDFQKVIFSNSRFIACEILNCKFNKCTFNDTAFIVKGDKITEIKGCTFENCNFSKLALDYTLFKNCNFINCKIKNTDFNGSRFEKIIFSGTIIDCFFRAKIRHLPIYTLLDKITGKVVKNNNLDNKMKNIDFTNCELSGISFCDGVDLTNCKFPSSERYLYIKDAYKTFTDSYSYISENWNGEELRLASIIFETVFMNKYKGNNQINDLIDFDLITENINGNFSRKIKEVLVNYL